MGEKINELPASSDIVGNEQFPIDQDPAGGTDYETVRVTIQKAVWQYTKAITADYTLADGYARVSCDATSAAIALTIASAQIARDGKPVMVIKTDSSANAVTIGTEGAETINGAATYVLSSQWQAVLLIPNGTNVLAWPFIMDAERTKLANIEPYATADQTGAEIKAAYEAESDTNAYTDAAKAKVDYLTVTGATDLDTIRTRVDALDAAVVLIGSWDASGGAFPGSGAAQAGWSYIVTVAGTVDGVAFSVNDRLVAITDNASTSTYADNWLHLDYSDLVASVAGLTGAIPAADLRTALDFANQARAAINNIIGSDGKADADLDMDGHAITGATSVSAGTMNATAQANDIDMGGYYLTRLQNIADLMARGPAHWFDGADDYIDVADNADLDLISDAMSIEVVFSGPAMSSDTGVLVDKYEVANYYYQFGYVSGELMLFARRGVDDLIRRKTSGAGLADEVCYHLVAALDGDDLDSSIGYVNGKSVGAFSVSQTATNTPSVEKLRLGGEVAGGGRWASGMMALVRLWNIKLSAAEANALSNGSAIPYKYIGGGNKFASDFSADDDGFVGTHLVLAGNIDSIGGVDNCLRCTLSDGSNAHRVDPPSSVQNHFDEDVYTAKVRLRIYIPSANSKVDGFAIWDNGRAEWLTGYGVSGFGSGCALDSWIDVDVTGESFSGDLNFYALDGASYAGIDADGDLIYIKDVYLDREGCVLDHSPDGVGHGQRIDKSGNELHGDVSGAIPTNLPTDHVEKYIDLTVTGDTTFPWPAGYMITAITTKETEGNSVTGGINVGITNGGAQIVSAHTVSASTAAICSLVAGGNYNTTGATDTGYITAVTAWNSANVQIRITMQKIDMD